MFASALKERNYLQDGSGNTILENGVCSIFSATLCNLNLPETKMTAQKKIILGVVIVCLVLVYYVSLVRSKRYAPGIMVSAVPQQLSLDQPKIWKKDDYRITALAKFNLKARVLSTERYWFDRGAGISPVDFALGWGIMSDQRVLDQLTITQGGRWYYWESNNLPASPEEIISSSSNMHMIPANDRTDTLLKSVGKGDIVELRGYLVEVTGNDGFVWRSSLSRTDTGEGSCEVFWVEEVNK